jgi:hypothetical protein
MSFFWYNKSEISVAGMNNILMARCLAEYKIILEVSILKGQQLHYA